MVEQGMTPVAPLLQRAQSWQEEGKVFQATHLYERLAALL